MLSVKTILANKACRRSSSRRCTASRTRERTFCIRRVAADDIMTTGTVDQIGDWTEASGYLTARVKPHKTRFVFDKGHVIHLSDGQIVHPLGRRATCQVPSDRDLPKSLTSEIAN